MITLMSLTMKIILSIILLPIFGLSIYLLYRLFVYNMKKAEKTKMLTLNLVVSYRDFLSYVKFRNKEGDSFAIFVISINNFRDLVKKHSERVVSLYVRRVVKNLSTLLPYGGKLTQSSERETFIMFIPNVGYDEAKSYADLIKETSQTPFRFKDVEVIESTSIGYTLSSDKEVEEQLSNALVSSIHSRRNLNEITLYSNEIKVTREDYVFIRQKIHNELFNTKLYEIVRENTNSKDGLFLDVNINNMRFSDYLIDISKSDRHWVNIAMLAKVLEQTKKNVVNQKIYLPVILTTLEYEEFVNTLLVLLYKYNISPNNFVLSIKHTSFTNQEQIVQNIILLEEYGIEVSYDLSKMDEKIFTYLQIFRINTVEANLIRDNLDNKLLSEVVLYAKVNQIDTILLGKTTDNTEHLYTHHTKLLEEIEVDNQSNRNKGWRKK